MSSPTPPPQPSSAPPQLQKTRAAAPHPQGHGHRRNLSTEISETARLDVVVPDASDLDIAAALKAGEGAKPSISASVPAVAHIKQRDHLFYG